MPASLDADARSVILKVTTITVATLVSASCYAYRVMQQEKTKNNNNNKKTKSKPRNVNKSQKKDRNSNTHYHHDHPLARLIVQCLASFGFMLIVTTVLTFAILLAGRKHHQSDEEQQQQQQQQDNSTTSSSINFCEWDFHDHPSVAEPANTASSIASYIPLALIGLFGKPSTVWKRRKHDAHTNNTQTQQYQRISKSNPSRPSPSRRFGIAYTTLLGIGIGSTLLHAMLTATTQGGDELPMLWFTASTGYIVTDIILVAKQQQEHRQQQLQQQRQRMQENQSTIGSSSSLHLLRRSIPWLFFVSAVVATSVYVLARDNFLPFYIMFIIYSWVSLIGLLCVCFGIDVVSWNDIVTTADTSMNVNDEGEEEEKKEEEVDTDSQKYPDGQNQNDVGTTADISNDDDDDDDDQDEMCFKADVLLPIAICTAISAMVGIVVWTSEMVYCADAQNHSLPLPIGILPGRVGAWFYNRVAHVIWHCSSGLLAWLLIQSLVAAKGIQDGWGPSGSTAATKCRSSSTPARVKWWLVPYVSFDDDDDDHFEDKIQHIKQQ